MFQVNNNGHLTFNQDSSAYTPYSFPSNGSQDIIAGLWTDLDNRVKGVVSYQQYTNGSVLTNVTQDINTYFPNLNFNASWVFVATWNKVAYFNLTNTETSFQVLLISGSNYSFILMNYGDIAVTDHPVQAGYDTINSTQYFVIPGSNSGSSISNLRNSSNVNVPGRWAFRVDSGSRNSILKNNVVGFQVRLSSFSDLTQSGNIEIVLQQIKEELVKFGLPNSIELKLRKLQKINQCTNNCNSITNICNNDNSITNICNNNNSITNICNNDNSITNICSNNNTCDNNSISNNINSITNICNNICINNISRNNICVNNTSRFSRPCAGKHFIQTEKRCCRKEGKE
ncbi:uncharacterized protein [Garra rufa]|uniref:uncharacterized protein n=1 Tax=Garra rufa TaxID=137080 RepID=UPI003CCE68F5